MDFWTTMAQQINQNLFQYLLEGHAFLIDNVLQTYLFTMTIVKVVTWVLKSLNLFLSEEFSKQNRVVKFFIFILFLYVKIWNSKSAYLLILGYFCSISICLNLYSSCLRLGSYLCHKSKNMFGNISSLLSIAVIFLSYKVFIMSQFQQQSNLKYEYVALYFLIFGIILAISLAKNLQFIYVLIIMGMIALIINLRCLSIVLLEETFLSKASLPFESVFYILFAIQQSYALKQDQVKLKKLQGQIQNQIRKVKPCQLFKAQVYFYLFFLVNKRMYCIQLVFAFVAIFNYLGRKNSH